MEAVVIPVVELFDQVLQAVAEVRPTHLVGYASVIGHLARAIIAGALIPDRFVRSTNSEPLSEEDRDAIDRAWAHPSTTSGARPRSASKQSAVARAMAFTSVRTR